MVRLDAAWACIPENAPATATTQAKMVKEGTVVSVDGKEIPVEADTVCLHGDGKQAVLFARRLREELERAGIVVAA